MSRAAAARPWMDGQGIRSRYAAPGMAAIAFQGFRQ
jgi:hypothetical protein